LVREVFPAPILPAIPMCIKEDFDFKNRKLI